MTLKTVNVAQVGAQNQQAADVVNVKLISGDRYARIIVPKTAVDNASKAADSAMVALMAHGT